jgi:transposase InsO family protein
MANSDLGEEVQAFLGFANFYRRFIDDYSKLAMPLIALTRKNQQFLWTPQVDLAFKDLKSKFIQAPILVHPNFEQPFVVETDASDMATGAILSQYGEDGYLHPCAYRSSKMSPAEKNYDIYDKELLSVVLAFQDWRVYLEGSPHHIQVISDHKNLEYFLTTKQLNRRQARWSEFLSAFDFEIQHRPGSLNGRADALSRRIDLMEGKSQEQRPLLRLAALESCQLVWDDDRILKRLKVATAEDSMLQPILAIFNKDSHQISGDMRRRLQAYTFNDGVLRFQDRIYVPEDEELQRQILRSRHDAPAAGHQGRAKTLELVTRSFYWPTLRRYVHRYVDGCDICQRSKPTHHARYGLMQPIPAAHAPWKRISADFIVKLPISGGYDSVMVVVDKNTKLGHFIPTNESIDSQKTASLYLHHVWKHHGTPEEVISDRGPVFVSKFMKRLSDLLRIKPSPTTAFHPQADGQTERVNQVLEQFLRMFTTRRQDDWAELLPLAEFAYNNASHSATGFSPFYATYGYHPSFSFMTPTSSTVPAAEDRVLLLQQVHEELKTMIQMAGEQAKRMYDKTVKMQPTFQVGDKVLLQHDNIATTAPSKKLSSKFLGPFSVISQLSDVVYRLKLPKTLRIHDVFHVSLLERYCEDTIVGRRHTIPPPIVTPDGDLEYEVQQILDSRFFGRWKKLQYLVSWVGYGPEENSWEPASNLENAPDIVAEFHMLHPQAPQSSQETRH